MSYPWFIFFVSVAIQAKTILWHEMQTSSLDLDDDCYNTTNRGGMRDFKQCDPQWECFPYAGHAQMSTCNFTSCASEKYHTKNANNICASGCGITSTAMILTYFSFPSVIPPNVASWLVNNNFRDDLNATNAGSTCDGVTHGAICAAGRAWGLQTCDESTSFETLNIWLQAGPVIAHVRHRTGRTCKFTRGGHYIVIVDTLKEDTYSISDPNSCSEDRTRGTVKEISEDCSLVGFIRLLNRQSP